jgi:uncharacterized protein (TIGR02147 family)
MIDIDGPSPIFTHASYRSYLRACADSRIARNPAYSVRAFAFQLGVTPAFLSEILSGKKHLSSDKALRLAQKLSLDEPQTRYFCLLVQAEKAKTEELKQNIIRELRDMATPRYDFRDLGLDQFAVIADWYHLAIRNLTLIDGFSFTPASIASTLGITTDEASAAIERLETLNLIARDAATGRYQRTGQSVMADGRRMTDAVRRFQEQMLERGLHAYRTFPTHRRALTSLMVPADAEFLAKFDELADRFIRDVNRLSDQCTHKTQLFHVSVHGFEAAEQPVPASATDPKGKRYA